MKVIFERPGVPFNSSSSHSVVTFEEPYPTEVIDLSTIEYGRFDFLLKSERDKQLYCQAQLYAACEAEDYKKADKIFKDAFKSWKLEWYLGEISDEIMVGGSIDHDSIWNLPIEEGSGAGPNGINMEFFIDLCKYIVKDVRTVIFGGADGQSPCKEQAQKLHKVRRELDFLFSYPFYKSARKDNGIWVLTAEDGGVTLVSFEVEDMQYLKVPYLIDVQITDKCYRGCPYCYRACTAQGKEVHYERLDKCLKALSYMGVSNIVLGGGDVTTSKAFAKLPAKVTLSSTIATTVHADTLLELYENKQLMKFVSKLDGLGVSIPPGYKKMKQVDKALKEVPRTYSGGCKIVLQIIPELFSYNQLEKFFKESRMYDINLLGFKGYKTKAKCRILSSGKLMLILKAMKGEIEHWRDVMCDSTFITWYISFLKANNVAEKCLTYQEGLGTCFLDLVNCKMALSSYSDISVSFDPSIFDLEFNELAMKLYETRQELIKNES